jgi:hypothetical protein
MARMAESADAADLKSADRKVVGVQVPLRAPIKLMIYKINASSGCVFLCPNCVQSQKSEAPPQTVLVNSRMSVSRGAHDAQIFTNDRERLPQALGHDVSHQSAHIPDRKPPQPELAETPKHEKSHGMDMGLSL